MLIIHGIIIVILACILAGVARFEKCENPSLSEKIFQTIIFFCILGCCFYAFKTGEGTTRDAFVTEVNMNNISIEGESAFIAQVEITYEDGDLKSVELIPGSTAEVVITRSVVKKKKQQ